MTQNGNPFQSGSGSTFSFTPNLNGTYLVTLTVTDAAGGKGTATLPIVVAPVDLRAQPDGQRGPHALGQRRASTSPGDVVVDSSSRTALSASGNAQVTASAIDVVGGVQKSGNATFSPAPTTGVRPWPTRSPGWRARARPA